MFGASPYGAAQAGYAVLSSWAAMPAGLGFAAAAAIPAAAETAARALDQLGVEPDMTLLINGASGSVGSAAVQLALARGATVIGTASPATHEFLRSLGAVPVAYGDGMPDRVRRVAGHGIDLALDIAGNGILPQLIELTGSAERVLTVADVRGAQEHGVRFSRGDAGRATYALADVARRVADGAFRIPIGATFPLEDVAEAHRAGESGTVRGKLILLVDDTARDD